MQGIQTSALVECYARAVLHPHNVCELNMTETTSLAMQASTSTFFLTKRTQCHLLFVNMETAQNPDQINVSLTKSTQLVTTIRLEQNSLFLVCPRKLVTDAIVEAPHCGSPPVLLCLIRMCPGNCESHPLLFN
jgi:hypothetical protein